jgi:hypothetical protein
VDAVEARPLSYSSVVETRPKWVTLVVLVVVVRQGLTAAGHLIVLWSSGIKSIRTRFESEPLSASLQYADLAASIAVASFATYVLFSLKSSTRWLGWLLLASEFGLTLAGTTLSWHMYHRDAGLLVQLLNFSYVSEHLITVTAFGLLLLPSTRRRLGG